MKRNVTSNYWYTPWPFMAILYKNSNKPLKCVPEDINTHSNEERRDGELLVQTLAFECYSI